MSGTQLSFRCRRDAEAETRFIDWLAHSGARDNKIWIGGGTTSSRLFAIIRHSNNPTIRFLNTQVHLRLLRAAKIAFSGGSLKLGHGGD
jgi:hypothetical protein